MKNILRFNDEIIEYNIVRGKRKRLYICIKDGEVEVRVPMQMPEKEIINIVESKAEWIYKGLKKYPKQEKINHTFENGDKYWILGNRYTLNIFEENKKDFKDKKNHVEIDNEKFYVNVYLYNNELNQDIDKKHNKIMNLLNKYYSRLIDEELSFAMEKLINKTGLVPNEFKTRNFKSSWGNCSSKKVISLNTRLIYYSRHAIEYVCLHELCHLKYMNHSKDFWNLVSKFMPDYKLAEKELKEHRG